MGTIVVIAWILWVLLLLLHINRSTLIPLKIRVTSFYIPVILTTIYSFTLNNFLGYLAIFAVLLASWDDWDRRHEMN